MHLCENMLSAAVDNPRVANNINPNDMKTWILHRIVFTGAVERENRKMNYLKTTMMRIHILVIALQGQKQQFIKNQIRKVNVIHQTNTLQLMTLLTVSFKPGKSTLFY
ncbi:uncharacterized protein LOC134195269 [Corticium candelabrum]|uniref:uncharacterized protein LOC134195269 n=1 Tax=Corticium candelabrum TaxID=121492 RepID=UPI002E2658B7|nr:uncharacterized protein LOC134195269 [Corticium candelabrum]XP_062520264.1 uncharacterized protein LOC134195269 [Corticium candelabrum]